MMEDLHRKEIIMQKINLKTGKNNKVFLPMNKFTTEITKQLFKKETN